MNARKKSLPGPLDKVSENQLPDRIAELESQVAKLRKDVAMLKQWSGWPLFADEDVEAEKKKPGPQKKIGDELLFHYRDAMVLWLEPYWSWLEDHLLAASTVERVKAIVEAVAEKPELRPEWQERLLENAAALHEFLGSERFRKRLPKAIVIHALNLPFDDERRPRAANQFPSRRIANAMAGIPDIGWRRSLDRCSAQPSKASVPVSMDMFYRDKYGLDAPKDFDLTGASCPVPKPFQPVLSHSGDDISKGSQPK